jgi:hypothetical protein
MRLPQQNPQRPFFAIQSLFAALLFSSLVLASVPATAAQVTSNQTQLHFGSIVIGQSESLPVTFTNPEKSSVTISSMISTSNEFSVQGLKLPLILGAGQTATFNVVFAPTIGGWQGGDLTFISNAGTIYIRIGGVGVGTESLKSSTSSLGFAPVVVGSSSTLPVVLTNSGTTGFVIAQAQLSGTSFSLTGPSLPITLQPNQSATFDVIFKPGTATTFTGSFVVPNGSLTIPISGTGITTSQLLLNPAAVNFGNVDVGTTSTQPVTLSASGGAVTISSSASSSSQFALQGASFPLTIPSGQSVSLNLAFTPSANGNASGTVSLASNASDSNAQEALSGVGITPTYNVTVSWSASTSQVTGYNIYRGVSTSSYAKLNSALNPSTTFTDSNVTAGQTYYYVATAVNSTGQESPYSTPVQAVVP